MMFLSYFTRFPLVIRICHHSSFNAVCFIFCFFYPVHLCPLEGYSFWGFLAPRQKTAYWADKQSLVFPNTMRCSMDRHLYINPVYKKSFGLFRCKVVSFCCCAELFDRDFLALTKTSSFEKKLPTVLIAFCLWIFFFQLNNELPLV